MNLGLMVGAGVALLLLVGVGVLVARRRSAARAEAEREAAEALQARRRGAGATIIAGDAPSVVDLDAPRRKAEIGLSPWQPGEGGREAAVSPAPAPAPMAAPVPEAVWAEPEPAAGGVMVEEREDEPVAPWPLPAQARGAEMPVTDAQPGDAVAIDEEKGEEDWSADDLSALIGAPRKEPEIEEKGEEEWSADDLSALIGTPKVAVEAPLPAPVEEEEDLGLIEATIASPAPGSPDEPPSILSQLKKKKKGGGANPLAGAVEGGPAEGGAPTVSAPREVEESVTLVLKRRIGDSDGGEVRSWLGGLPMMAEGIEWPRAVAPERPDEGPVPLNFVAQICCEDFPAELWGGLGPRSGWLLFFLNPRDSIGDDPRLFKIIHVDALGPERQPPEDARPVHDEVYAGADYRHFRNADEIPVGWRKWPVDLVAMPNEAFQDGDKIIVTPKGFAAQLHGAPVEERRPDVSGFAPFSWRGALHVVDSILRELDQPFAPPPVGAGIREALGKPGYIQSLIPMLRHEEDVWLGQGEGAILLKEEPLTQRQREAQEAMKPVAAARKAQFENTVKFITDHHTADKMVARIEADARAEAAWRDGARAGLEGVRSAILQRDLDSPLADADWQSLADHLDGERFTRWTLGWTSRNSQWPVALEPVETSLLSLGEAGLEASISEVAADYYADPARRGLVPDELVAMLEPWWRKLLDNRPHRIGGFHDGLQSDPEPGAQPEVLLLQLASDEAMTMMWGDEGAYFIFITPQDLANGRFGEANIRLECY